HTMRAGKVQLESVHASILHFAGEFLPALFVVLLHDRRDEHVVWILFLDMTKLFEPDFDWSIGNQLDILESNHLVVLARAQLAIAWHDVDDFARLETDRLRDRATPAGVIRFGNHPRVRSRRARAEQKWIGEFDAVYGNRKIHNQLLLFRVGLTPDQAGSSPLLNLTIQHPPQFQSTFVRLSTG